ncbi:MAG: heparinase II/III family protein [Candidatus Pacebacteria bacterium]|nr:heparinase II/III family protein [Candidatus Paceibacterota bacterium]
MVQRQLKIKKIEIFFIIITIILFFILGNKYIIDGITKRFEVKEIYNSVKENIIEKFTLEEEIICGNNQIKISVQDGGLCREKIDEKDYKYLEIYDTYPKSVNGKEIIYDFLDEGDIVIADAYLKNEIKIERYNSVKVDKITWEEDPFGERYWRFIFYSLRDTRHLLYAYQETKDERYKDKLIEIIESFIDNGIDKPHAWDDYHGVAFRTMTLINTWWKLREQNVLSVEMSEKILKALQRHGEFLLEEEHYEEKYNHGINQMVALLILSVNFPDLEDVDDWFIMAKKRLHEGINTLVDDDGILVENSPYYHFYTLEKYWLVFKFTTEHDVDVGDGLKKTVDKMISYATYILQPNLDSPILGASLERRVGRKGTFKEIAKENSEFLYVLTQGKRGKQPSELSKYYPIGGQVIMRSEWERKTKFENKFEDQTQIIFDVGPYRTAHSDFDALSFVLYSNGKTLITDSGLYTYEFEDELKSYFHGTRGHNTILIDGKDQRFGTAVSGKFKQGGDFVFHSAQHNLYPQIHHQRTMILLGHDLVLIIDRLISDKKHDYEQLFHLFPKAKIEINNTTVTAIGENEKEEITIHQLLPNNIKLSSTISDEDTGNGFCSFEYEKKVPCYMLSYKQHAKNTSFITLLEIGDNSNYISAEIKNNKVILKTKNKTYDINLNELDVKFLDESFVGESIVNDYNLELGLENNNWFLKGNGSDKFQINQDDNGKIIIIPKNLDNNSIFSERPYYVAEIDDVDSYYSIDQNIYTDIPMDDKVKQFKIYEQEDFVPILGYHHIIEDGQEIKHPTLEMHVSNFEKQVNYMTNEMGCRWFTFGDIMENYVLKNKKIPKRTCIMNFDDGRKNHFTFGYQTFKKYGAVATFYIITDRILSSGGAYMSLSELDKLHYNGNEIGSHTVSASSLITNNYNQKDLIYQFEESKRMLEEQGYKITTFAYPRGNQNQKIVNLTKQFYIAGRDTSKDNKWRDRRPSTVSFDKNYLWHMHYHKPEIQTPKELEESIGYNTWWQFEEGYRIDRNYDNRVRTLSSVRPTDSSFASVFLEKIGNKISNKFIVSKDSDYVIEVFGTVNVKNLFRYTNVDTIKIYIDNVLQRNKKNLTEECVLHKEQYYCFYNVSVSLKEGLHTISIEANQKNVKVDKFRMYRPMNTQNSYNLKITELKKISPREHPNQIEINIKKHFSNRILILIYIIGILFLSALIYLFINFKKKII